MSILQDYHNSKFNKDKVHSEQPFWIPILAGGTARIFAATLVSPLELVRTKMQSQQLSYAGERYFGNFNFILKQLFGKMQFF